MGRDFNKLMVLNFVMFVLPSAFAAWDAGQNLSAVVKVDLHSGSTLTGIAHLQNYPSEEEPRLMGIAIENPKDDFQFQFTDPNKDLITFIFPKPPIQLHGVNLTVVGGDTEGRNDTEEK